MKTQPITAAAVNSDEAKEKKAGVGFTPEQIHALTSYFGDRDFTKETPLEARPFTDPDFGGFRFSYFDFVKQKYPALNELARVHRIEFTNALIKAEQLEKLFIGNLPVKATKSDLLKALDLGDAPFQLMIPVDKQDSAKNRGFAFLTTRYAIVQRLMDHGVKLSGTSLSLEYATLTDPTNK